MDLDRLQTFVVLAELGHMTRASLRLHLTQPALSTQLKRLEEELGQRLFDRTPKGLDLTEAGRVFLPYAKEAMGVVARGKEALEALEGLERGRIAVGGGATATTYLLPRLLGQFHLMYPHIHLFIQEQGSASTLDLVVAGELDLGIVTLPADGGLDRRQRKQLVVESWALDELRLMVPPQHALCDRAEFAWSDLEGQPMVLFEAGSAVREIIDERLQAADVEPRIVMELRSIESIKQMVVQGIGAAFLSRFALPEGVHSLRCVDGALERQLVIVYRKDRALSRAVMALLALLRGEKQRERKVIG